MSSVSQNSILLVDNHSRSSQLYSVGLEAYVGAEVTVLGSLEEAVEFLSSNTPSIIITRSLIEQREAGVRCAQIIEQGNLKTHLIILGQTKVSVHQATIYDDNVEVRDIIKKCALLLGVTAKAMAEKDVGEYYPIKLSILVPNLVLVCPIYKKNPDGSFVKFLDVENKLHPEILTILKSTTEDQVYVQSGQRLKFVNSITIFLAEMMADDRLTLEDSILFANNSYNIVRDSARRMMISPITIHATEANINTMISITGKIPKLNQFLKMTTNSVSPVFRHSLLTTFVASHIIEKMEWGTNEQKVKIAFVCFFSNLLLTKDEYILTHSDEDLTLLNCSDADKDNIKNHAINAAKLLGKYYTNLPFGIETIVKQHHGNRYGMGFSQNPSSISPLALVYIISDEWVSLILRAEKNKMPLGRAESLNLVKNKYKGMMFLEIINALNDLTI